MEMLIAACFLPSTRQPACAKIASAVADARGVAEGYRESSHGQHQRGHGRPGDGAA